MPTAHAIIGNRIRQIRKYYKLSQAKFAQRIGVSQRFISDLERGTVRPPEPLLLAIEYIYQFRREWVITGDEPMHIEGSHPAIIPEGWIIQKSPSPSERKILNGVVEILESGNKTFTDAFEHNVLAFLQGVRAAKEKRRYPRVTLSLPVDFEIMDEPQARGIVLDASQMGLLIQSSHNMPIGKKISLKVLFSKNTGPENFRTTAEIVWKEKRRLDDSEAWQYGVKLVEVLDEGHLKLESMLQG